MWIRQLTLMSTFLLLFALYSGACTKSSDDANNTKKDGVIGITDGADDSISGTDQLNPGDTSGEDNAGGNDLSGEETQNPDGSSENDGSSSDLANEDSSGGDSTQGGDSVSGDVLQLDGADTVDPTDSVVDGLGTDSVGTDGVDPTDGVGVDSVDPTDSVGMDGIDPTDGSNPTDSTTGDTADPDSVTGGDQTVQDQSSAVDLSQIDTWDHGAPSLEIIKPTIVCDFVYIEGANFGNNPALVSITWGNYIFSIKSIDNYNIVAQVTPSSFNDSTGHKLIVTTPGGSVTSSETLFVVDTIDGFGCSNIEGHGLIGTVYQLKANTGKLPDIGAQGCSAADIIGTCPQGLLNPPNLDVPTRSFSQGFPGVSSTLVEWFAIRFEGRITVPSGTVSFRLCSDDGSILWLGQPLDPTLTGSTTPVIDNDGVHSPLCKEANFQSTGGTYDMIVDYFQGPQYHIALELFWKRPGEQNFTIIPIDNLLLP